MRKVTGTMSFVKNPLNGLAMQFSLTRFLTLASCLSLVLIMALFPGAAVLADDLTISDTQETAVDTASGDGTGPGDIIIEGSGTVELTSGTPVTINSNHSLVNVGSINTDSESDATAVLVDLNSSAVLTSGISNNGLITVLGPLRDVPSERAIDGHTEGVFASCVEVVWPVVIIKLRSV